MNVDYTVTALMFPAIPLLMNVYGNRFHTLSALIRKIHDEYIWEKHIPHEWEKQLINLNGRVKLFERISLGKIKIKIFKKYQLEDVVQAHKDLEARKIIGPAIIIP